MGKYNADVYYLDIKKKSRSPQGKVAQGRIKKGNSQESTA
jgi:hypothetical protein